MQDVTTQDLSGVLLHRTGGVETATDGKTILPTYEYNLDNQRGQDVRAIISFSGSNLKVRLDLWRMLDLTRMLARSTRAPAFR